jgi:hypothetical protein
MAKINISFVVLIIEFPIKIFRNKNKTPVIKTDNPLYLVKIEIATKKEDINSKCNFPVLE